MDVPPPGDVLRDGVAARTDPPFAPAAESEIQCGSGVGDDVEFGRVAHADHRLPSMSICTARACPYSGRNWL